MNLGSIHIETYQARRIYTYLVDLTRLPGHRNAVHPCLGSYGCMTKEKHYEYTQFTYSTCRRGGRKEKVLNPFSGIGEDNVSDLTNFPICFQTQRTSFKRIFLRSSFPGVATQCFCKLGHSRPPKPLFKFPERQKYNIVTFINFLTFLSQKAS